MKKKKIVIGLTVVTTIIETTGIDLILAKIQGVLSTNIQLFTRVKR